MSQSLNPPPQGAMFLFDYVSLPLTPDSYKITANTQVQGGNVNETFSQ
jgi:hypothetical protein